MLALRVVPDARGPYLLAHLSPPWPGCAVASDHMSAFARVSPAHRLPMLCDLRHGAIDDFPRVLEGCLRLVTSDTDSPCDLALLVSDGSGVAQTEWMEALARAVGVRAQSFVDEDQAIAHLLGEPQAADDRDVPRRDSHPDPAGQP